ncbi:TNFAIP3-interacting protein 2 isoform X1 [Falco rusticolus]|uniref:TNFAIP3-interacting protein 2 isoform X1 n=1 Tax=Falco rusticolus TaxID=120794 RepID=UPI0018866C93|nr:TNFAIP3-interacting protein 2 isoform X1 [Falco rusticolus]XP_055571680.1 TNFAIP3-interacting protein 2 isoform X1 [Falco cherrug]
MHLAGLLLALEKKEKGQHWDRSSPFPAMCSVSEGSSTDPLVTRFKQVEETLERLHRENRSLKNKVPRYNALCTLYHESAQQLRHLQLQLAAKEATIRELRSSLARQATAAGGEAEAAGGEPARSLVESLLEQLGQAREQLRDSEQLSARRMEALNQEVQKLNQQLEEKNGEIQQMINQPPFEKEREILRLQKSLAEREKAQATSDVLCRSLTDETHQLQRKLASTAEMCQHLAKCLEEKQRKEKGNSDDQTLMGRSDQLLDNETSLQALICNLQDENRMLKQKVAHVEDLNAKWQKYDASRDEYVKRLHLQLKEMKSQLEQQHGVTSTQTNSDLMHKEILRLNKLLEEKMNECIKTRRELEDVKKASEGDNERIQMLEQQVLVYKDDFTSERSDRERAQSKIQELQAEVACLQHQLARRQDSRDTSSHFRVHIGNQNHMHVQTNVEHLLGNSPGQTGMRRTSSQSEQASPPADNGNSGSEGRAQGELRCPHCMRFFSDELSDEFLKHVAECCQ